MSVIELVSRRNFSVKAEVERTLLHDRDVLLCGNHLEVKLSVIWNTGEGAGIRTLSICGGRLDLSSLEVRQSISTRKADVG